MFFFVVRMVTQQLLASVCWNRKKLRRSLTQFVVKGVGTLELIPKQGSFAACPVTQNFTVRCWKLNSWQKWNK